MVVVSWWIRYPRIIATSKYDQKVPYVRDPSSWTSQEIKCAVKFASEQHKHEAGWLVRHGVRFAVLLILSQPVFFSALRLCCSEANFNARFILRKPRLRSPLLYPFVVPFDLKPLVFEQVQHCLGAPLYWGPGANCPCCPPPLPPQPAPDVDGWKPIGQ